jgi:hypothetical protein
MSETASRCSSSLSIDSGGSCGTWRRLRHLQTLRRTVCSLGSRSARFRTLGAATIILCVVARNGYDSRCGKLDTVSHLPEPMKVRSLRAPPLLN